jgi:hypothetical protein
MSPLPERGIGSPKYIGFNLNILLKKSLSLANISLNSLWVAPTYCLGSEPTPYASIPNWFAIYIALNKWYFWVIIIIFLALNISFAL